MKKAVERKSRDDIMAIADYEPYIPRTSFEHDAIDGALKPLDKLASEMESRWGVDRLQRMVSSATSAKFEAAKQKLNIAILDGKVDMVIARAEIMYKGWIALEKEALALGNISMPPELWFASAPAEEGQDGVEIVIARDADAATLAQTDLPVYTTTEVARIIRAWRGQHLVHAAKIAFPDAELVKLTGDDMFDDDVPF